MWTRKDIKSDARDFLRKHYWKAFLVCLIEPIMIVGIKPLNDFGLEKMISSLIFFISRNIEMIIGPMVGVLVVIFTITAYLVLKVGQCRFFLKGFEGDVRIENMFSTFNSKESPGIVKTMYLRAIFNMFWFSLFIIPGIIKYYEYKMVPYILSEYPNLGARKIIKMSQNMTKGHKLNMFILDIYFLIWYVGAGILDNILIAGISIFFGQISVLFLAMGLFVSPYYEATFAELYNVLSGNKEVEKDIFGKELIIEM